MFYVYVLRNRQSGETYIGYTNDLRRRFEEHKHKHPELVYYEAYKDGRDARKRERMLKHRGQGVRWLKDRLAHSLR